jgi:hypothetical protein
VCEGVCGCACRSPTPPPPRAPPAVSPASCSSCCCSSPASGTPAGQHLDTRHSTLPSHRGSGMWMLAGGAPVRHAILPQIATVTQGSTDSFEGVGGATDRSCAGRGRGARRGTSAAPAADAHAHTHTHKPINTHTHTPAHTRGGAGRCTVTWDIVWNP